MPSPLTSPGALRGQLAEMLADAAVLRERLLLLQAAPPLAMPRRLTMPHRIPIPIPRNAAGRGTAPAEPLRLAATLAMLAPRLDPL